MRSLGTASAATPSLSRTPFSVGRRNPPDLPITRSQSPTKSLTKQKEKQKEKQLPEAESLLEAASKRALPCFVLDRDGLEWVGVDNLSEEAAARLTEMNEEAAKRPKAYVGMKSLNKQTCLYCITVRKKGPDCKLTASSREACAICITYYKPCAKILEYEGQDICGFLPLPVNVRGNCDWEELDYWVSSK